MTEQLIHFLEAVIRPFLFLVLPSERIYWFYLLAALLIALVVYIRKKQGHWTLKAFTSYAFPKAVYIHPSAVNDYKFFFINAVVLTFTVVPLTASLSPFISNEVQALLGGAGIEPMLGGSPPALSIVYTLLMAMFIDLGIFLAHYLQHRVPFLWEFHKVHHSAEVLQPMTVYRLHPVDELLNFSLSALLAGLVDGVIQSLVSGHIGVISIFSLNFFVFAFYLLGYNLRHSQIWVDYGPFWSHIFVSPAQHQIHHSLTPRHFDKNMGFIFAFWDKAAGTLYVPKGEEALRYGLNPEGEHKHYSSVWAMYTRPFARVQAMLRERLKVVKPVYWVLLLMLLYGGWLMGAQQPAKQSMFLEELTWREVRDFVRDGYTTAIIPTGGTEQNGPHGVLGKHNYIVRYNAGRIAEIVGHTLVAPVVSYVPEGDFNPPTEHMRFSGTLSVPEPVFEAILENAARSLKTHGFKTICFVGDSGGNQKAQARVAQQLNAEWQADNVSVLHVGDYYADNGQVQSLLRSGHTIENIGTHAGIRDTSELMAVFPQGVRTDRLEKGTGKTYLLTGVLGDPAKASPAVGKAMLDLKVRAAVRQIREFLRETSPE